MNVLSSIGISLRYQLILLVFFFAFVLSAAIYVALRLHVYPVFEKYEHALASTDLERVEQAIQGQFDAITLFNRDYSEWDDSYQFVRDPLSMPTFLEEQMYDQFWSEMGISLMIMLNLEGELVWGMLTSEGKDSTLALDDVLTPLFTGNPLLTSEASVHSHTRGFIDTPLGLMMIATSPMNRTDGSGPVAGSFIVGSLFDNDRINDIAEAADAAVTVFFLSDPELSERVRDVPRELGAKGDNFLSLSLENQLLMLSQLRDLYGDPVAVVQTSTERQISEFGADKIREAYQLLLLLIAILALASCVLVVVLVPAKRKTA